MDSQSLRDPVELIYDQRIRGALLISVADQESCHIHGGCWLAICGLRPARLMAAIPKEFAAAEMIERLGRFTVSVSSEQDFVWQGRFYRGDTSVVGDPALFVRSPDGAPVPLASVGYVDFTLLNARDLGDFLLVVGAARHGAVLNETGQNITVNSIVAKSDPRADTETVLPYDAFPYDPERLAPAPADTSPLTDQDFLAVFGRRHFGLYLASTLADDQSHLMVSAWGIQVSHRPARMALAARRESAVCDLWQKPGASVLISLLSDQDEALVSEVADGGDPAVLTGLIARQPGLYSSQSAIATFLGHVTERVDVGDTTIAVVSVDLAEDTLDQGANLMAEEVAEAAGPGGHLDPGTSHQVPA